MRWIYLFPLVVVGITAFALFSWAALTPLPANGPGRTIYDVHTVVSLPAGSSQVIQVGGEQEIPLGSLVVVTVGVLIEKPDKDTGENAYFRLSHAGLILEEDVGGGLSLTLETHETTVGEDNPQLLISNDQSFPLEVELRAFVTRPPTTLEKFSMYVGFVIAAGLLAALWPLYLVTIGRSRARERKGAI